MMFRYVKMCAVFLLVMALVFSNTTTISADRYQSIYPGTYEYTGRQKNFGQPSAASVDLIKLSDLYNEKTGINNKSTGIVYEVKVPWEQIRVEEVVDQNREYVRVEIPGWQGMIRAGAPVLPVNIETIGVPFSTDIRVNVIPGKPHTQILSAPVIPAVTQTSEWTLPDENGVLELPQPVYVIEEDAAIYGSGSVYPGNFADVTSDGIIRSQRVVGITTYPVQFNPSTLELTVYETLTVEVTFDAVVTSGSKDSAADSETYENLLEGDLLNYESAKQYRDSADIQSMQIESEILLQEGTVWAPLEPGWRIKIREDGFYKLTHHELQAADSLFGTPPVNNLRLFNMGSENAIQVVDVDGDTNFNSISAEETDYLMFYGQGIEDKYTKDNVYWLTYGIEEGLRMGTRETTPSDAAIPESNQKHIHFEQNKWYNPVAPGDENLDRWFGDYLNSPSRKSSTIAFSLTNPYPGPATLRLSLLGFNNLTDIQPDHHVVLSLNGSFIGESWWDGLNWQLLEVEVGGVLQPGLNTLTITAPLDTGGIADVVYIDWMELDYIDTFVASGDGYAFKYTEPGTWKYQVDGFTIDQVEIFDVSNPAALVQLTNFNVTPSDPGYNMVAFQDAVTTETGPISYQIRKPSSFLTVAAIEKDTASNLRSSENGADHIVITHGTFMSAATALRDHRASQGLRAVVVDVQDVYDEFGFGIQGAAPIRAFLAYTLENWQGDDPSYVVLFGDGHYDPKNYAGYNRTSFIPPFLAPVDPELGETAADNRYVTLLGEDILPDMMLGRLAVNTSEQATALVNKLIAYENSPVPGDWIRKILVVADDGDEAGDFASLSDGLISAAIPPAYQSEKVYYLDTHFTVDETKQAILAGINSGKLIVNYIGHGSQTYWATEKIFESNEGMTSLSNGGMLPIMLPMTCWDGYYIYPFSYLPSTAEVITRSTGNGAVASWSPTGLGDALGHDYLNHGFFEGLFSASDAQVPLGTAISSGLLKLHAAGEYLDLLDTYLLFGDPALNVTTIPFYSVSGTILDSGGTPVPGVEILDELGNSTFTDELGNYVFEGLGIGLHTLSVQKHGYSFNPTSQEINIVNANLDEVNFTGTLLPVYSVSGNVSDSSGNPIAGVVISQESGVTVMSVSVQSDKPLLVQEADSLGGLESAITDEDGNYTMAGLIAGSYSFSAQKTGYTFTPEVLEITVIDSDLIQKDFTASLAPIFSISGTITDGTNPIPGVGVSNGISTTTTDASGYYEFLNLTLGSYTITPTLSGYAFTPAFVDVPLTDTSQIVDFTGTRVFSISGTIIGLSNNPVSGVTVSDGAGHSGITNENGDYQVSGLPAGTSVTLTPALTGYVFEPVNRSYTNPVMDISGADFTAKIPATHSISLVQGWNLVSFNVRPDNTDITAVLSSISGNYDMVWAWDATGASLSSGNWKKFIPGAEYGNTLTTLDETQGFWIHMTAPGTLVVIGVQVSTSNIPLDTAALGWNLVGYPSAVSEVLPDALTTHGVDPLGFSTVWAYHGVDTVDPWKLHDRTAPEYANDLTVMAPGWGYWIYATAEDVWNVDY